jgi:hypothetical protein
MVLSEVVVERLMMMSGSDVSTYTRDAAKPPPAD